MLRVPSNLRIVIKDRLEEYNIGETGDINTRSQTSKMVSKMYVKSGKDH